MPDKQTRKVEHEAAKIALQSTIQYTVASPIQGEYAPKPPACTHIYSQVKDYYGYTYTI